MNQQQQQLKTQAIDLGLSVLCTVTPEGQTMTQNDIAEVCNCSRTLIYTIEKQALRKFRERALKAGLDEFVE